MQSKPRSPSFVTAFLFAPFAGAVTAVVLSSVMLFTTEDTETAVTRLGNLAFMVGIAALVVCTLFTAVVGGVAAGYVSWRRRVPSLAWALAIGFIVAAGVFGLLELVISRGRGSDPEALGFAAYAGVCSLPLAWAFWRLGLRGRTVAE